MRLTELKTEKLIGGKLLTAMSYTALLLLWLPAKKSGMPLAAVCFFMLVLIQNTASDWPERKNKSGVYNVLTAAFSALMALRFIINWMPSAKIDRLAAYLRLPKKMMLGALAVGLAICGCLALKRILLQVPNAVHIGEKELTAKGAHYTNFDAIKAVAAACIVLHHYQQSFEVQFAEFNFFGGKIEFGWLVELFFMLSGFLAVSSKKRQKGNYVKQFTAKCLRFFPSVLLSLAAILAMLAVSNPEKLYSLTVGDYLVNFFLCFSGWGVNIGFGLNNPTWYLCILIQCYLLYYLVDALCRGTKIPAALIHLGIGTLSVYLFWYRGVARIYTNLRGISCFFLGAFLYAVATGEDRKSVALHTLPILLVSLLGLRLSSSDWGVCVVGLFPAMILLAASLPQLQSRAISELGRASFQTYIWHGPMMRLADILLPNNNWHSVPKMLLFLIVVELFACGMYHLFEIPTSRWIRSKLNL